MGFGGVFPWASIVFSIITGGQNGNKPLPYRGFGCKGGAYAGLFRFDDFNLIGFQTRLFHDDLSNPGASASVMPFSMAETTTLMLSSPRKATQSV